ncbi:MAG: hypothetical protein J5865_09185 [Lachnospiraceae bacterium]|nr:hypothetical protein [Lachnospiraceae bacterium]
MHIRDLARQAESRGTYTYSAFLSPAELSDILARERELIPVPFAVWGGSEAAERKLIGFGSETWFGYPPAWPICVIAIEPAAERFAEDLSHRDYLGALMSLGIERSLTGDIVIRGKNAWLYCLDLIADHICENLTSVRHTAVRCHVETGEVPALVPQYQELRLNVASERIDAITAAFIGKSRSSIGELFTAGKVFVNSRAVADGSKPLKEGDVLSVRGFGKAVYDGVAGTSKKGRSYAVLRKYV